MQERYPNFMRNIIVIPYRELPSGIQNMNQKEKNVVVVSGKPVPEEQKKEHVNKYKNAPDLIED